MKNKIKKTLLIATVSLVLILLSGDIFAQNGRGNRRNNDGERRFNSNRTERMAECFLNLTVDQQAKLSEMRTTQMKEMLQNRNVMTEKRAHLNTLRTADNVDMKAINTSIDDISDLSNKQFKNREAHLQDVRNILTDSQRVEFDNYSGQGQRMGKRNGMGRGNSMGVGNRVGFGNGNGNRPCLNDGQRRFSRGR